MNRKSRGISIFNLITSLAGVVVVGYFAYFFSLLLSIGYEQADTDALKIRVIFTTIAICLPALMCFVNFVMSCVSFKYLGRGEKNYSKGFHIAMFIVELVALVSFVVYGIVNASSLVLLLIGVAFVIIYGICAIVHIVDFNTTRKQLAHHEVEQVEATKQ